MRVGQLTKRITLQRPTKGAQNAFGEPPIEWVNAYEVYAQIEPFGQGETVRGGGVVVDGTHRITIHYRRDVATDWRVVWGGRTFRISQLLNVGEKNRELQLVCHEVT